MTTEKQMKANRKNAKKGGVKSPQGKEISKYNALKHGLLAKAIVINTGDGKEKQEDFDSLLAGLNHYYNPEGSMESILVEKIAVSYWRLRRAKRYEMGKIRSNLDTFYNEFNIGHLKDELKMLKLISKAYEPLLEELNVDFSISLDHPLSKYYDCKWNHCWEQLAYFYEKQTDNNCGWIGKENKDIHQWILDQGFKPSFQEFCDISEEYMSGYKKTAEEVETQLHDQELKRDRIPLIHGLLPEEDLKKLLRYETAIEKQFYQAMMELERLQKTRCGALEPLLRF